MIQLSITIPCRNEAKYIAECLEAIYASEFSQEVKMRVFVVDGLSDDGTRDVVEKLTDSFDGLEILDNQLQLTPYAFNIGIKKWPEADYFQIVGARHIISPNYLQSCIDRLQKDESVWCVGGRIINQFENEEAKLISTAMSSKLGMGPGNFRTLEKSGYTDTVTSPMYPAEVFEKVGYFDEELVRNQDDDFNFRVIKAGGKIWYEHDISLKYYVRSSMPKLWKQFNQYGYWKVYVNKKHGAITTLRQLVPPLFVAYTIAFVLFGWMMKAELLIFAPLPLLLYGLLIMFTAVLITPKKSSTFKLMAIFPLIHFAYGLGYLKGILHFIVLNKKPAEKAKTLSR